MRGRFKGSRADRRRQRGAALLAFSVLLAIVSVGLLVDKLATRSEGNTARERGSNEALARAKADLIAWSVSHPTEPGRLPWPDRNGDGDYDGTSDCVTTGFGNTHLLGRFPHAGDTTPCDVATFSGYTVDGHKEPLWYAVSRNLLWNRGQTNPDPALNPGLLDNATYPWLTVRDQNGNVLSNRVAAVLIAPGGVVGNQVRSGAAPNPSQFLDSVTIGATTYDNADADLDFIIYPNSRTTTVDSDSFNDQLTYITIDELMRPVEKRVLGDAAVSLQTYRTTRGRFPWLSPYRDPASASGDQTLTGRIESVSGSDITDNDASFPTSIVNGDLIINVTRRTLWVVNDRESSVELEIQGSHDFQAGDAYNLLPAFNGIWGGLAGVAGSGREGHIPFIDTSVAETFDVATGFTITWNNGTVTPNCAPLLGPLLTLAPGGCTLVTTSLNGADSGAQTQPAPDVPASGAAGGDCIWTDIDSLDCNPDTFTVNGVYTVDLCVINCGFLVLPNIPVDRTYTFPMNFTGSGQRTTNGNVKTRRVTNTSQVTIQVNDTVLGLPLGDATVDVNAPDYSVDGIYFDIEDNNEFPGYFFTNLWHQYIYAKVGADHVAINTATGNPSGDNCTAGTDCLNMQIAATPIRNDIQAVLVGAGGELGGQNRSNGNLSDYFENSNATQANDTVDRGVIAATFNDQVRVIRPNPP